MNVWLQVVMDRQTDKQADRLTDEAHLKPLFCYTGNKRKEMRRT